MQYVYRSTKAKYRYHIGDQFRTACNMQHCEAFSKLDTLTETPPLGRKLCIICAQQTGQPYEPRVRKNFVANIKGTEHEIAPALQVVEQAPTPPPLAAGRPFGKRFPNVLRELDMACIDSSRATTAEGLLILLCGLRQLEMPPSMDESRAFGCLRQYQKSGKLDVGVIHFGRLTKKQRKRLKREVRIAQYGEKEARTIGIDSDQKAFVVSDAFLSSYEWRKLRYEALKRNNGCCELCGQSKASGAILHVDHIKPRRKFWKLALVLENLQVLCSLCNHGKGNWDQTDWRDRMPDPVECDLAGLIT